MDTLVGIGEFSKMTYLSVKALRHYHDVGLLEPADIDPSSGYRRYATGQVPVAHAIRRFRELDMPIDEIRVVLQAPDAAAGDRALLRHLERMQQQLEVTQQTVASLQSLLSGQVDAGGAWRSAACRPSSSSPTWRRWRSTTARRGSRRRTRPCTPGRRAQDWRRGARRARSTPTPSSKRARGR